MFESVCFWSIIRPTRRTTPLSNVHGFAILRTVTGRFPGYSSIPLTLEMRHPIAFRSLHPIFGCRTADEEISYPREPGGWLMGTDEQTG
jgi:hypothetical protein